MEIITEHRLSPAITISEIDKFPDEIYRSQLADWLTSDFPFLPWHDQLLKQDSEKLKTLGSNLKQSQKIRMGLFENGNLKGWSFGWQESAESFFMGASCVAPELRRRGYYTQLAQAVLEKTRALGFQSVSSNHILTNNPIIIAKLKLGFTIKGMEVDAVHGTLLKMVYHHNPLMKSAARFRVGAIGEADVLNLLSSQIQE